jgi:hypothetical protein
MQNESKRDKRDTRKGVGNLSGGMAIAIESKEGRGWEGAGRKKGARKGERKGRGGDGDISSRACVSSDGDRNR